jgi:hypothetical protein
MNAFAGATPLPVSEQDRLGSIALVSVAVGGVWFQIFERPFLSADRHK